MAKPAPRRHANHKKQALDIKIRKDDQVKVITGLDQGKIGRVLEVDRKRGRVTVEGVMVRKKTTRANPAKGIKGGIAEREMSIHASNVMLLTSGGVPTRVGTKMDGNRRVRVARKTGETLDKK
jgi:large subunit ribosomal protein L24